MLPVWAYYMLAACIAALVLGWIVGWIVDEFWGN
jgi:F0F1-type ATP synthase assembly protein I